MNSKTKPILMVMNVLAWITFIGLIIKSGIIITSYGISTVNPEYAKNIYQGWDLYNVRQFNFWNFTGVVSLMVAVLLLEAYTAYLVIRALDKIKLSNPFTLEVSRILEKISYYILGTWVVVMLYNAHVSWLSKKVAGLQANLFSGEFILVAGVVFVFSQIFKRGVEIQSENELTV